MTAPDDDTTASPSPKPADDRSGHRQRLRTRLLHRGGDSLADYEVLEMLLFAALARGDTKPLAKRLLAEFGSLGAVLTAAPAELVRVKGMGEVSAASIKIVQEAVRRLALSALRDRPVLSNWQAVVDYCRIEIGHESVELLQLLFLDRKNRLIAAERHQRGTVDHTPVYPREVIKRALELGASALILVHNHPSGDPTPSRADIAMTKEIREAADRLSIAVHDHIVIGAGDHFSFKANGLL